MIEERDANSTTYFFWLFDWDKIPVNFAGRFQPNYTFCRIDRDEIYLQDARVRFAIPLSTIQKWNTLRWASIGALVSSNVELTLFSPIEVYSGLTIGPKLYLMPMNVFKFGSSYAETKALVQVLDYFNKGVSINLDPNPYVRNWKSGKRKSPPVEDWDPVQPPYVYTENPATLSRLLIILVLLIVLAPIITIVLGLLFNLLLRK